MESNSSINEGETTPVRSNYLNKQIMENDVIKEQNTESNMEENESSRENEMSRNLNDQPDDVKNETEDNFSEDESNYEAKKNMASQEQRGSEVNIKSDIEISNEKNFNSGSSSNKNSSKNIKSSTEEANQLVLDRSPGEPDSGASDEEEEGSQISKFNIPKMDQNDEDILEFYRLLREQHNADNPWEDPEFPQDVKLLWKLNEPQPDRLKDFDIEFLRPDAESEEIYLFATDKSPNIDHEFKIKRGILNDKFFVGAVSMLFRKKEQFFKNLILDYDHVNENLKCGFCGFTFFINGEWRNVTVDTFLPWHQGDELALSVTTSTKSSFWLCLLQKAYSKVHKTYDVLNNVSIKNTLVDLTGGISKKIPIKEKMEDFDKKFLFDEIKRCISQKYLIGCMRFDLSEDNFDESRSDQGEDEEILPNCLYNILDIQEVEGYRLIYLVNYWNRGKWSKDFGPDDEAWETNKALKEKLEYDSSVNDGTFWMRFEDWLLQFNTLYYCRIFPESWSQFCIPGAWSGMTSGGAPPRNPNLPWIPERLWGDTKNVASPSKGAGVLGKPSIQLSTLSNKNSISSGSKEFSLSSVKKKSNFQQNFKFNLLPAVDEDGEHNPEIDNKFNRLSVAGTSSQFKRVSMVNRSTTKKSFGASTNNLMSTTKVSNLNQTNASSFRNPPSQTKSQGGRDAYEDYKNKDLMHRVVLTDTEDRWFLNPQYKVEIRPGTKLIISLMQEDEKLSKNPYQKCNFMIILTNSKYSRVWDLKEENLIKKACDTEDRKISREIMVNLDYNEILRKMPQKRRKRLLSKSDRLFVNIVPYLDYHCKYEVEKVGNSRLFKLVKNEGIYWLRIFSSDDIAVTELSKPYERSLEFEWTNESAGGGRYIKDLNKNRIVENAHWPINPQYLLKFENNINMKIILRKLQGRFSDEEAIVGMLVTKPSHDGESSSSISKREKSDKQQTVFNKNDQILRVLESTNKILESKKFDLEFISRKMSFNSSEWVVESSYSNNYCASLFMNFNKIDSPIMLIPSLEYPEATYGYKLSIYSNKPVELFSLNNDDSKVLIGEWKEASAGGCHLTQDDNPRKSEDDQFGKKIITWYDNPKFHISFDYKDRLPEVEFEIIISRSETIWKKKIANSIVNSMIGVYIFKYDKDRWKEMCVNLDKIDFLPKNEISVKFRDSKVDPKGYIIMPATYGHNVTGPFAMMVKCRLKYSLQPFVPKKIVE